MAPLAQGEQEDEKAMVPSYVIIPVKNRHTMTSTLLSTLARESDSYAEILIFDNESDLPVSDTDLPLLAPRTKVYTFPGTGVINAIWNEGAEYALTAAGAEFHNVVYLNNDIQVGERFISELVRCLRSAPDIGIVYPNFDNRSQVPNLLQDTRGIAPDGGMSGFAFAIRGELHLRVDPRFRWWCGDADLELKARLRGYRVSCATHVPLRHLEPYRSTAENPILAQLASEDKRRFREMYNIPDVGRVSSTAD
jgi:hypothetical protein